jgi:hypothetical protein
LPSLMKKFARIDRLFPRCDEDLKRMVVVTPALLNQLIHLYEDEIDKHRANAQAAEGKG